MTKWNELDLFAPPQDATAAGAPRRIHVTGFGEAERAPQPVPVAAPAQSLLLNPERLRALPDELRDYNCSSCDRRAAGWAFLPTNQGPDPDPVPICSLCWLYLSHWGRACVREVPAFLARYEVVSAVALTKDAEGRLTDHRQGDAVVLQLLKASVLFLRLQAARTHADGR